MACFIGEAANCPEEDGPDLDIGASTSSVVWTASAITFMVGQKSGDVYALDPDKDGADAMANKVGRGGFLGGVHWGMSADGDSLFVPIADTTDHRTIYRSRLAGYPCARPDLG